MSFSSIWSIILKSNTFNFIIFLGIIIAILYYMKAPELMEKLRKSIEKTVTDSNDALDNSKNKLDEAKAKTANVENEVSEIIEEARKTAEVVSEKIIGQANTQIQIIEKNTQSVLDSEQNNTKKQLEKVTTKASLDLVEANLRENLKKNPKLHQTFIDEAIDEIEALQI